MRLTPIQTANLNATVHKMDIESLEPEQREQLRQVLLAIKAQADPHCAGPPHMVCDLHPSPPHRGCRRSTRDTILSPPKMCSLG
jgi:hypothetical protein